MNTKKVIVTSAVVTFVLALILTSTVFAVDRKDNTDTYEEITAETFASLRIATEKEVREHLEEYYAVESFPDNDSIFKLTSLEDQNKILII